MAQDTLFELMPQNNQTGQHWWLAWAARKYLLWHGALCAGMEVAFWQKRSLFPDDPSLSHYTEQYGRRADVLAVMRLYDALSRTAMPLLTDEGRGLVTVAVDAKASRADFKRGFDDRTAHFNYLAAPEGMIEPSELPAHFGLLVCAPGMVMRRRAKCIEDPRLVPDDAVWAIAGAGAQETRRMQPTMDNPFADKPEAAQ